MTNEIDKRPDTSHLGEPYGTLHLADGTEIAIWQQDSMTYPFLARVVQGAERGFGAGVAIVEGEHFEDGVASLTHSVRLLQHVQPNHVVLESVPRVVAFIHALVFTAAAGEVEPFECDECGDPL